MHAGDDSPAARGARLRQVRLMAGLNSSDLAEETGFSRTSISYWENATHSGLSHTGAERIVKVLEKHGVKCDIGWLWLGVGDMPTWKVNRQPDHLPTKAANTGNEKVAAADKRRKEIQLFTKLYEHAIVIQIKHNLMKPLYEAGDWVGGCWTPVSADLVGKSCIVQLSDALEVRILKEGTQFNKFNLCFMAYSEEASQPFELNDLSLKAVAPIIRVWR